MHITTGREVPRSRLARRIPLIGLTATVVVGSALGLWMVFTALTTTTGSQAVAAGGHAELGQGTPMPAAAVPHPVTTEPSDPMAGMSDEEMAAMGHAHGTHPPAPGPTAPGRPLGATLAGFGAVNMAVLLAGLCAGRSRRRSGQRPRVGAPAGSASGRDASSRGPGVGEHEAPARLPASEPATAPGRPS